MKRLLYFLSALLAPFSKADGAKLGSDGDPIRRMLFASQSLEEQVKQMHLNGEPGGFQDIADAAKLAREGKKQDAIARLQNALQHPDNETRIILWTWAGLRELGMQPDGSVAGEVLGAVIEMPSGGGYDTLAAYADGTARYLNFSGKAIFWDQPDEKIKALCKSLIDSTIPASGAARPRTTLSLPKGDAQVTLLTRSGNYVIVNPPQSVVEAGAALMIEMMNGVKQGKNAPAPKKED
ncbi:hypothetical protein [Opitutus sp. ER46]|uniref:hypothetical protein n=1 Tax=Opitutus sp. ER46 TaxID=2161864 RepID=UPI0011B1F2A6|nr:hypothetical protein [Opitutus sp. ER46]